MQTYGSLAGGYRPHLDSEDFAKFLRGVVVLALLLSVAFSIRGNYLGLEVTLERNPLWLGCIAAGLTLTSMLMAMLSVMRVPGVGRGGRALMILAAVGLFLVSMSLTYIGFSAGEQTQLESVVQEHSDVRQARADLAAIIQRLNQYGLSHTDRASLLQREKEQREYVRELEKRIRFELGAEAESKAAAALGSQAQIVRVLFSISPDLSIAVLSPILVFLFGAGASSWSGAGSGAPGNVVYPPAGSFTVDQSALQTMPQNGQTKLPEVTHAAAARQGPGFDPF